MDTHLTINEVATRTGLSAHTLRYYERAGLIAHVARAPGGQRRYAVSDMDWIGFLLRLRTTHMPIRQMQQSAEVLQVKIEHYQMLERSILQTSNPDERNTHASKPL